MSNTTLRWQRYPAAQLKVDQALASAWDRLNGARKNLPFLSSGALCDALDIFGDDKVQLFCANAGGQICAMFMLRPQGRWHWTSFQPSQMPLGAWVSDGSHRLVELARQLQRQTPGPCLVLSITQIDPWLEERPVDSPDATSIDYVETGWIEVSGDFEAYWAARGKNLRQNMRKQRNRFEADGVKALLSEYRKPHEMSDCVRRYGAIESKGWKAQEGTAIHPDNDQGRFYRQLFEAAASIGEAVVYEYRFDDNPVAMDLCLQRGDLLVVLKTTYDESIKHCSPAFLLRQDELQTIFQQSQIRRLEFYGKFMEWHSRWTEDRRMLYHYTQFRWAWLQRLAQARRAKQSAARDALRAAAASAGDEPSGGAGAQESRS